jgi:hypothetical protein
MGVLTFSINVTLDGCVDHREGIADDETHAHFTRLMDERGAMLWGRVTYEMMESYWPAVARGDEEAPPAMREWAVKLQAKPKYVVSSTRNDFPWTNSHHIAGDLRTGIQKLSLLGFRWVRLRRSFPTVQRPPAPGFHPRTWRSDSCDSIFGCRESFPRRDHTAAF